MEEAVILVAGEGKRLRPFTYTQPKCFAEVMQKRILVHSLEALSAQGCERVVVVTGHLANVVVDTITPRFAGMDIQFVHNDRYATTNSMFSLALGLEHVNGGAFVLEGDVFLEPAILREPTTASIAWFVDSSARHLDGSFVEFDASRHAMTQKIVRDLSTLKENQGKSIGVLKADTAGVKTIKSWLSAAIAAGRHNDYYDLVLGCQMPVADIQVVDVAGSRWFEVDNEEDLNAANRLFS